MEVNFVSKSINKLDDNVEKHGNINDDVILIVITNNITVRYIICLNHLTYTHSKADTVALVLKGGTL